MKRKVEPCIVYMATYPPRECGIATFTRDISDAVDRKLFPTLRSKILAMNNNGTNIYNYPKKVALQLSDTEITDYLAIAKRINQDAAIGLVNIQHEFGIFGGEYGEYLIPFLEILKKPAVITFHSVLQNPNEKLRRVVREIAKRVKVIIVMTKKAVEILHNDYKINTRIHVIPHGIPDTTFETQKREKRNLGMQDKIVLSSFGMIGPGKGYEYVIEALPEIVRKYPNLLYIIVGETHPMVRKKEGEKYRNMLESRIKELKLQKNVKFYNKYVTLQEIIQYLKATDIYLSTSDNPNQITSGTMVYALGCGRAVISTPFLHAKDIITENRGRLTEFQNPDSFKEVILELLDNNTLRKEMEINSYHYTRHMTWQNVATSYGRIFKEILKENGIIIKDLPQINIKHLLRLTDNFGIIQFANQSFPDKTSGYTLDDNARALLTCAMHYEKFKEYKQLKMIKTYLKYINFVKKKDGKLYNFVNKSKIIDETNWSEDAHGRALWALGYLYSLPDIPQDFRDKAERIFLETFPATSIMTSPRAIAYTITGLYYYNKIKNSSYIVENIKKLADFLTTLYKNNTKDNWRWFEQYMTYSNSKLPEALYHAYLSSKNQEYLTIAEESLNFMIEKTFNNNFFVPIGQKGWYFKDKERAYFDQQPIEAGYTVQTLITAYKITKNPYYKKLAYNAFQWFLGKNILKQVVYNETTGGTHDGIGENSINLNQGAEATVSYLLARLSLMEF